MFGSRGAELEVIRRTLGELPLVGFFCNGEISRDRLYGYTGVLTLIHEENQMAKAVRYHKQGGPEVLQLDDVEVGDPGPGQVRVRHTAIGVNFVDTYQRSGLYPMQLPAVAGNEGAGVVEAVGAGVKRPQGGRPRHLYRAARLVLRACAWCRPTAW